MADQAAHRIGVLPTLSLYQATSWFPDDAQCRPGDASTVCQRKR